jgi:hypothetical protein
VVIAIAVLICAIGVLKGTVLIVQTGSWAQEGILSNARASASASLLQDGRILVTGGDPGTGPSATADFINTDGTVSIAPQMTTARSKHISVTLQDGRVLVGGQWGAAVYSSFSTTYATASPANSNVLGVNPEDGSADAYATDSAGTPENYKSSVMFGGTGGGLTNYTGNLSTGAVVVPTIAPMRVSPNSLGFAPQTQLTTSASMTAVLTNNDAAADEISGITIAGTNFGDFALVAAGANNCVSTPSLASGASCTLYVTFKPTDVGTRSAKIVIVDQATNSPQTVYLSGTGN